MVTPYPSEIESRMQRYHQSLSEKDRRRYAAIEALKLGHGGISYISGVLGCDYKTIKLGMADLDDEAALSNPGMRRAGGGRKSSFEVIANLDETFLRVIAPYTAGSPMDEHLRWTNLNRPQIAEFLSKAGVDVSVTVVDQLLAKHNYRRRKLQKTGKTGEHPQRNEQFETIQRLKEEYEASGNPVISMDTKKRS